MMDYEEINHIFLLKISNHFISGRVRVCATSAKNSQKSERNIQKSVIAGSDSRQSSRPVQDFLLELQVQSRK